MHFRNDEPFVLKFRSKGDELRPVLSYDSRTTRYGNGVL